MSKTFVFLLGLLLLILLSFGFHGDNRSIVTVKGTVIDGDTGKPLDGAGVTAVFWVDRVPDGVEPQVKTTSDGEFSLRLKLNWAVYPYNLIVPAKYESFELFFLKEGYESRWIDFGEFRVKRTEVPDQVIEVGRITLVPSSGSEKPPSLTLIEKI